MQISGLVVCVDFSDLLARSIDVWRETLDDLTVVTSTKDEATRALCSDRGVMCRRTDAFYRDGCVFNKGAAIAESYEPADWHLFFDADIVPPDNWRELTEKAAPKVGHLHGARRIYEHGPMIADGEMGSWFHLFHSSDSNVQRRPVVDCGWRHAGGYDSEFSFRWGPSRWVWLPFAVRHLGERGVNWWGRGNGKDLEKMMRERAASGSIGVSERIDGKTTGWR